MAQLPTTLTPVNKVNNDLLGALLHSVDSSLSKFIFSIDFINENLIEMNSFKYIRRFTFVEITQFILWPSAGLRRGPLPHRQIIV